MKIKIEIDAMLQQDEVILRCRELNDEVLDFQKALKNIIVQRNQIVFYKDDIEYYFSLDEIIFFETEENGINAHTKNDIYQVKYKLYELEEILPMCFTRVSKSTILNINHIFSISKKITSSSVVEFQNTHKQVYVSRHYYKLLKIKLMEKRR